MTVSVRLKVISKHDKILEIYTSIGRKIKATNAFPART